MGDRRELCGVMLALVTVTVWVTWPLASRLASTVYDPVGLSRTVPDYVAQDIHLTVWIVGWVARTLVTAPRALFEAPIFHPIHDGIAYSEHMLGAVPITLPAYWVGGSLFAHELLLVASFVLSAVGMALLARWWMGSGVGALVAGVFYALAPWRFRQLFAVHLQCVFYLPFVLLFASRYLSLGLRRDLWLAVVTLTLQALCSYSLAYPTFAAVLPFLIAHALCLRTPSRRGLGMLVGVASAAVLVSLVSLPYLRVQQAVFPPVSAVAAWTPEHLQRAMSARFGTFMHRDGMLYPGSAGLALAACGALVGLIGAGSTSTRVDSRALLSSLCAFALPLVILAFGPYGDGWAARVVAPVWRIVPGLSLYRSPVRFGFLVALPVAALAGLAAAWLEHQARRRWPRHGRRIAWTLGAGFVLAACLQLPSNAVTVRPFPSEGRTPAVYDWLAEQACDRAICPVLELPTGADYFADPRYVYWTLRHGHPILNGYSGYAPASYPLVTSLAQQLPSEPAVEALAQLTGVRWIVVHRHHLTETEQAAWEDPHGLARRGVFGEAAVYEVPQRPDVRQQLLQPQVGFTFTGVPLTPLAPDGRDAHVRLIAPERAVARQPLSVVADVRNASTRQWPAFAIPQRDRVALELLMLDPTGRTLTSGLVSLPRDLVPGEEVRVRARLTAPARPEHYRLTARVVQEGEGALSPQDATAETIEVVP